MNAPAAIGHIDAPPQVLTRTKLGFFGSIGFPLGYVGLPLLVWIPPFYAADLGISLATVGFITMFARSLDIVTDPLVGAWSDRTTTPWGRRKPFIAVGAVLFSFAIYKVFVPVPGAGALYLFGWVSVFYLGYTLISLPSLAWGAQLSPDYEVRTKISGMREFFVLLALLMSTALPGYLMQNQGKPISAALEILGQTAVLAVLLCIGGACLFVHEPRVGAVSRGSPWRELVRIFLHSSPLRRLLAWVFLVHINTGIVSSLLVLYATFILGAPALVGFLLLFYFTSGVVGTALIVRVANKLGKHRTAAACNLWNMCGATFIATVHPGDIVMFGCALAFAGFTVSVGRLLGRSMAADVVDADTLESDQTRAGLVLSMSELAIKAGTATGIGIAYPLLEWIGFSAQGSNSPQAILGLLLTYTALPALVALVAGLTIWGYPITAERQREIRAALEQREHERLLVEHPIVVKIVSEVAAVEGKLLNVSQGGLFVTVPDPPAVGQRVQLTVCREEDDAVLFEASGHVARRNSDGEMTGVGIAFGTLSSRDARFLESLEAVMQAKPRQT